MEQTQKPQLKSDSQFAVEALQMQRNEQADRAAQASAIAGQLEQQLKLAAEQNAQLQSQLDDTKRALTDVQNRAAALDSANVNLANQLAAANAKITELTPAPTPAPKAPTAPAAPAAPAAPTLVTPAAPEVAPSPLPAGTAA